MSLDYLEPVPVEVLKTIEGLPEHILGKNIEIFTKESGLPDILAIIPHLEAVRFYTFEVSLPSVINVFSIKN